MKKILFALCLLVHSVSYTQNIAIFADFSLDQLCTQQKISEETGCKVHFFTGDFSQRVDSFSAADKILLMNNCAYSLDLQRLPKEKLSLFIWEAIAVDPAYSDLFSCIYTFNDDLVDGKRFFKFHYPVLTPMLTHLPDFEQKKLCALIALHATPSRLQMIEFFCTKPSEDFDFYGYWPIAESLRYRGRIEGHPLSPEKFEVLKNYRFSICFENSFVNGYITEKIFASFAAGCVPIYFGAPNVEQYIPKDCFIDYRDFKSDEELYHFIKTMPKESYLRYIDNIAAFLQSEKAHLFSADHFVETIHEASMR